MLTAILHSFKPRKPHLKASFRTMLALRSSKVMVVPTKIRDNKAPVPYHAFEPLPLERDVDPQHQTASKPVPVPPATTRTPPTLLVMIDLTTLEKTGRFQNLDLVRVLKEKRSTRSSDVYCWPYASPGPFGYGADQGKRALELGLKLLRQLPSHSWPVFSCWPTAASELSGRRSGLGGL